MPGNKSTGIGRNVTSITVTLETRLRRNPEMVSRNIAGEQVLVPIQRHGPDVQHIYVLNEVGSYIWDRLAEPANLGEIAVAVAGSFDVDQATAEADVLRFAKKMLDLNIFRTETEPGA
jgi:hypothetical protein